MIASSPPMHAPHPRSTPPAADRRNPALCASALSRLGWGAGALLLLWLVIAWALS